MSRIRPTHLMSAQSVGTIECTADSGCPRGYHCNPDGVCVDDYDTPASGPHDVVGGTAGDPVPARYMPQGAGIDAGLIRTESGERTIRSPMIEVAADLAGVLTAGDTLALDPLVDRYDAYDTLEAQAIHEIYSGRRARPQKTLVELAQN